MNDPDFLADPRFWQPVSSEEDAVGTFGGSPNEQTRRAGSKLGEYDLKN